MPHTASTLPTQDHPVSQQRWDEWLEGANRDPERLRKLSAWYTGLKGWMAELAPDGDAELLPLRPPIFGQARYEELAEVSHRLVRLTEAALAFHGDPEGLLADMGLPDVVRRCFGRTNHGHDLARAFARADLLLSNGQVKALELNVDSGIGGMVAGSLFPNHYMNSPGGWAISGGSGLFADSPLLATVAFLRSLAREAGLGPRPFVAILEWEYHVTVQRAYAALLAQYGLPSAFVRVEELEERDGFLYTQGQRIDIAIKNFSMGSLDYPDTLGAIEAAVQKGGTLVLADSRSVLSSNKRMLATLSQNADRLNGRDRQLVERYVPWTREVRLETVRYGGEDVAMRELLAGPHRKDLVLKRGSGEGGLSVVIGANASAAEWDAVVVEALGSQDYVVQEHTPPDSLDLPYLEGDRVVWRKYPYVLGQFVIAGEPGGLFVRFSTNPEQGVINFARGAGIVTALVEKAEAPLVSPRD